MFDYDFKTMQNVIKNLCPQDTRIIELASAISMILLSSMFLMIDYSGIQLFNFESHEFWVMIISIMGGLQLSSLVLYPKAEILRCITSWTNGTFWVWCAVSTLNVINPNNIVLFVLGISNLYAFIINVNLLRHSWEK